MTTWGELMIDEVADFTAVDTPLDGLPEHIKARAQYFVMIAICKRRKARCLGNQHSHHFAPPPILDDVLVDEAELRS